MWALQVSPPVMYISYIGSYIDSYIGSYLGSYTGIRNSVPALQFFPVPGSAECENGQLAGFELLWTRVFDPTSYLLTLTNEAGMIRLEVNA